MKRAILINYTDTLLNAPLIIGFKDSQRIIQELIDKKLERLLRLFSDYNNFLKETITYKTNKKWSNREIERLVDRFLNS